MAYLCPGNGSIWMPAEAYDASDALPSSVSGAWIRIPHLQSWSLEADVEEPDEFVTSDTGGIAAKPCPGVTSYTVETNFKLVDEDWLFCYLLANPAGNGSTDPWQNPAQGITHWFYLSWENPATKTAAPVSSDPGIYIVGTVNPSGFAIDNNSSTAAESEPSIEVSKGPFFPSCGSYTDPTNRPIGVVTPP